MTESIRVGLVAMALVVSACDSANDSVADSIYINGRVYTVNATDDWADAVAIRSGKIIAVGTNEDIEKFRGADTSLVDLNGRMLMPGIHDMHIHPYEGGIKERFECGINSDLEISEILVVVQGCADEHRPGEWVRGAGWATTLLSLDTPPSKENLDTVTNAHPVFLMDWALHNAWLNSRALAELGITDDTPDPDGGQIVRDPVTGEATGLLIDNAAYEAQARLPAYTGSQNVEALRYSIDEFAKFGITNINDAHVTRKALVAYRELADANELKVRVHASLAWKSAWSPSHEDELAVIGERINYEREKLHTGYAKIMLDGVPMAHTSVLLDPYMPSEEHGSDFRGELIFRPDELAADVVGLDAKGLSIKIHATGDRSARVALDAFEAAREASGDSRRIHELSHAQFIHPDDIPRFRQLNVAAEMCPILWYPDASGVARARILGEERAERMWPMKDLLEAGALVFYGSDWPAVVPTANPWPGIEAMVTRRNPYGEFAGAQWPEQAISLADAVRIVTQNGATVKGNRDLTGSIEVGNSADFIVLDRNIFEVPIESVSDVNVLATVVDGRPVYERAAVLNRL